MGVFGKEMEMLVTCMVCRLNHEAMIWTGRWPTSNYRKFFRTFIVPHSFGLLVEACCYALFVWATGGAAGGRGGRRCGGRRASDGSHRDR